jgi:hypothetical protein
MARDLRHDSSRHDASWDDPTSASSVDGYRSRDVDRSDRLAPERAWSAANQLELPRTSTRRPVMLDRERFMLRESESELLATVGAFRAIALHDFKPSELDVRSLRDQGLMQTHSLVINGRMESVAVLTEKGSDLIEHSRAHSADRDPHSASRDPHSVPHDQRFYAGLGHLRELAHDAQLYRMFETERARLATEGATVTRVVLDYELKAEYHRYVHEQSLAGVDVMQARRDFADTYHLPFAGERIHLPDVRVEYETGDGRCEQRDLELATEHYSRSRVGEKAGVGFRVYRAAGAGGGRRGDTPSDPHHLEWLA